MRLLPCLVLAAKVFHAGPAPAEIAVAIRYLKPEGVSHSHVYLYRDDGKLLRQLTKDDGGQDRDPFFAPDGRVIIFTRELKGACEYWSVNPQGRNLRKLDAAPEWYAKAPGAPFFQHPADPPLVVADPPGAQKFMSPDGATELILRVLGDEESKDDLDGSGTGKHFLLRDVKSGEQREMGKLPGFVGLMGLLQLSSEPKLRFLIQPPQRLAFFSLHMNSTSGDTVFAVDLNAHRITNLSSNWATPFPLAGEPAFLTLTSERYVPIPNSKKTANCSHLERWDANLKKVRYAADGSAAIFYGASVHRPGRKPAIIYIHKDHHGR